MTTGLPHKPPDVKPPLDCGDVLDSSFVGWGMRALLLHPGEITRFKRPEVVVASAAAKPKTLASKRAFFVHGRRMK